MPAASEEQTGDLIKGIAGSAGTITAPARVLGGPQDFGQMQPGDVLVASITTPAWTSLFAMASGVVTDIGGPLSHSSIVAREYGIPAVLGTAVATRRIRSGQLITVDGEAGTVRLLNGQEPPELGPVAKSPHRRKIIAGAAATAAAAGLTAWLVRRARSAR
jgi:pyruvate,water dikinase